MDPATPISLVQHPVTIQSGNECPPFEDKADIAGKHGVTLFINTKSSVEVRYDRRRSEECKIE